MSCRRPDEDELSLEALTGATLLFASLAAAPLCGALGAELAELPGSIVGALVGLLLASQAARLPSAVVVLDAIAWTRRLSLAELHERARRRTGVVGRLIYAELVRRDARLDEHVVGFLAALESNDDRARRHAWKLLRIHHPDAVVLHVIRGYDSDFSERMCRDVCDRVRRWDRWIEAPRVRSTA